MVRMSIARAALLLAVAFAGCRRDPGPQPVAPDPEPPRVFDVAEPATPPPIGATVDSWTPLLRLLPKAQFVAGADLGKLRQNALWAELLGRAEKSFASKESAKIAAAAGCGLELRDLRRIVVATDVSNDQGTLLAVEMPRVGEPAMLDCLMKASSTKAEWKGDALVIDDGAKHIMPQSADVIAIVDKAWVPRVEESIASSRAAPDPEVAVLLDRTDLGAGAWVVGFVPSGAAAPFNEVKQISITFDTTIGLSIAAWLGVDAVNVTRVRDELQKQFDSMLVTLPGFGVPEGFIRSVTFSSVGDGVVVHARATEPELRTMIEKLGALF
jgi:hypothetical protein